MATTNSPGFPRRPNNRPALPRIDYRIGAYPEIRDAMWRILNRIPELADWTHRAPDDPAVALVEVAAVVGDILTFYQQHYANETLLRTARWEESVRELVRLTGYRLGPPTGGRAHFAFTVRGDDPIEIPEGFPLKAELAAGDDPVDFLTGEAIIAEPSLGAFHLYRSRTLNSGLVQGSTTFEIDRVGGSQNPLSLAGLDLKKGDRLMILPEEPSWVMGTGSIGSNLPRPQIVKVKSTTRALDRLRVEVESPIRPGRSGTVRAYRIGRTFRHFGHNSPAVYHTSIKTGNTVTGTRERNTDFRRHWHHTCNQFTGSRSLARTLIPLDQEVNDLLVGNMAIIEVPVAYGGTKRDLVVRRRIDRVSAGPMAVGDLGGSASFVTLNNAITTNTSSGNPLSDLRELRFHETTSAELQLRRNTTFPGGSFTNTNQLFYYGTATEAGRLVGRTLIFKADDGRSTRVKVVEAEQTAPVWTRMRRITLNQVPEGFSRADFDEASPSVTVHGNVAEATQGKPEAAAVLGNGDMREAFQTFKLPKAPLTYLHDASATPPAQPELIVRVDGRAWKRVDSLFGQGPKDLVYIVRPDDAGDSWIQFGDGLTGARLPSGIRNITAEYRTGNGALGPVKPKTHPTGGARLDGLDKIFLPGEVTAGAKGEAAENARLNAPNKLQSLGRLVSLADYESETRSIPGVVTAKVAWDISGGTPVIQVRMLLQQAQQSSAQFQAAATMLRTADRARGLNRYPIDVIPCALRYVYLTVQCEFDPALQWEAVEQSVRSSLGLVGDENRAREGLFGRSRRGLGEAEYRLRIAGTVQNVPGILRCRVVHFGLLPSAADPTTLSAPTHRANHSRVTCTPTELLQLHPLHLVLSPVQA